MCGLKPVPFKLKPVSFNLIHYVKKGKGESGIWGGGVKAEGSVALF
jgi:hypothetical protein